MRVSPRRELRSSPHRHSPRNGDKPLRQSRERSSPREGSGKRGGGSQRRKRYCLYQLQCYQLIIHLYLSNIRRGKVEQEHDAQQQVDSVVSSPSSPVYDTQTAFALTESMMSAAMLIALVLFCLYSEMFVFVNSCVFKKN